MNMTNEETLVKYFFVCNNIHTVWNSAPECVLPVYQRYLKLTKEEKNHLHLCYLKNKHKVHKIINNM